MIGSNPIGAAPIGSLGDDGGAVRARVACAGPLGAVLVLATVVRQARVAVPTVLGAPAALVSVEIFALAQAPSMLGAVAALAVHDFTGLVGDATEHYVLDLITPTGTVRVPVSSWQATLQTDSSNYVQCVIPAVLDWVDAINAATEFVVSRRALLVGGEPLEYEMCRAPAEQAQFDRGPQRYTCTLSGYTDAFEEELDPLDGYDRTLQGIRSMSNGAGGVRVRCAIDWLLRPGHRAFADGVEFVASYINYYAPSDFDAYMDVGSRV